MKWIFLILVISDLYGAKSKQLYVIEEGLYPTEEACLYELSRKAPGPLVAGMWCLELLGPVDI